MDYNPLSPEVQDNPYPYYAELRNKAPVAWLEPLQCWAVSRYADVDFALRNPQIFSSSVFTAQALGDLNPVPEVPWILDMNPPDHTRLRKLANKGFTPVRPDRREWLITVMESVEDIPRQSLSAGIDWRWETFPEYLDALSTIPHTIDVGAQVPHAALRLLRSPVRARGARVLDVHCRRYAEGSRDPLYAMLTHPLTVMGGSDAGAHMRFICDVSAQTFMLTNWVRDCAAGTRYHLPLEFVVKKQTQDTARLFGMKEERYGKCSTNDDGGRYRIGRPI